MLRPLGLRFLASRCFSHDRLEACPTRLFHPGGTGIPAGHLRFLAGHLRFLAGHFSFGDRLEACPTRGGVLSRGGTGVPAGHFCFSAGHLYSSDRLEACPTRAYSMWVGPASLPVISVSLPVLPPSLFSSNRKGYSSGTSTNSLLTGFFRI